MSFSISSNSRMVGGLFTSMFGGSKGNSSGMGGFSLSEYASIRNGSYHKLLNSYYSLDQADSGSGPSSSGKASARDTERTYHYWTPDGTVTRTYDNSLVTDRTGAIKQKDDASETEKPSSTTSTSKDQASKLATIESDAKKLNSALNTLMAQGSNSIFKTETSVDKDGKVTTGYDTDKIYKEVSNFVNQYNALTKSAGGSKVTSIRSASASLGTYSKQNEKQLAEIGIKVDSKTNTLSIDEETFKKADMKAVKSLFQGSGSYGYKVNAKASSIDYQARYEATKANTYNSFGGYSNNYSSGSLWTGMV